MSVPRWLALVTGLILLSAPGDASARPQLSIQGQVGYSNLGTPDGRAGKLALGSRFELLLGRESPRDGGLGPYVEARTAGAFSYGDYGGGLVGLLPINPTFPLWLGGGALGRREAGAWAPAAHAFAAWGSRSFNYQGAWGLVAGLTFDLVWHGGERRGVDVGLSATLDLQALTYPWLLLVSWLRH